MQVDYIRRDIPEEISEEGGARIQIVNKSTIGLTSSINAAIDGLYVVGTPSMIEGYFTGLMRSVFEGIRDDGHPRSVGDVTFFPVPGGTFDLDRGWDPAVNDVRIKARLASGLTLDVSDWTFRDVTPGRQVFSIDTVSDGTAEGVVSTGQAVALNGRNFPDKALLTVTWTCGLKSGTVAAAKFTTSVSRIDLAADAITGLAAEDDGKEITFTVKGCYNKAQKTATVVYVAPPGPTVTSVTQTGIAAGSVGLNDHEGNYPAVVNGTLLNQFDKQRGDKLMFDVYDNGVLYDTADQTTDVDTVTATGLQCSQGFAGCGEAHTITEWAGKSGHVWAIINGVATAKINVTFVDPR